MSPKQMLGTPGYALDLEELDILEKARVILNDIGCDEYAEQIQDIIDGEPPKE